jgi:hypothetical protein
MPNHILNKITVLEGDVEKFKNFIKSDNQLFDFNNIIPMPELLNKMVSGVVIINNERVDPAIEEWIECSEGTILDPETTRVLSVDQDIVHIYRIPTKEELKELQEIGYNSWYTWACDYWGTKWNAYGIKDWNENSITFETAWSNVSELMLTLSKKLGSSYKLHYSFCTECAGSGAGEIVMNGKYVLSRNYYRLRSKEAYELYLKLDPSYKWIIQTLDGEYIHIDEDIEFIDNPLEVLHFKKLPNALELSHRFNQLSKIFHPDLGGDHDAFVHLKKSFDKILQQIKYHSEKGIFK